MNFNWKHKTGALALSVAMLSVSAGAQVAPAGKPVKPPAEVVQPAPSVDWETGQIRDKGKPMRPSAQKTADTPPPVDDAAAPGSTERGIKDPAVKGCGSCGITGKEAAPPPADDGAAPPSAEWETGQIRDKGKPPLPTATERRAHNGPGGTPPSTAKNELCGLPYTAKCVTNATAKKGRPKARDDSPHNRSSLLPVLGGVAALAAIAAAVGSGGNDNPASP